MINGIAAGCWQEATLENLEKMNPSATVLVELEVIEFNKIVTIPGVAPIAWIVECRERCSGFYNYWSLNTTTRQPEVCKAKIVRFAVIFP